MSTATVRPAFDGQKLRALREASGMNQQQLGEALGMGRQAINNYEQGRREPSGALLLSLARILGASVDDFFSA